MNAKIIELRLPLEVVSGDEAVLPTEQHGPTVIRITPQQVVEQVGDEMRGRIEFRIAFEPQNSDRRQQPYRYALDPEAFITDTQDA